MSINSSCSLQADDVLKKISCQAIIWEKLNKHPPVHPSSVRHPTPSSPKFEISAPSANSRNYGYLNNSQEKNSYLSVQRSLQTLLNCHLVAPLILRKSLQLPDETFVYYESCSVLDRHVTQTLSSHLQDKKTNTPHCLNYTQSAQYEKCESNAANIELVETKRYDKEPIAPGMIQFATVKKPKKSYITAENRSRQCKL